MQLHSAIFKAYDIRGTTPTTLNEGVAEALGLAFGTQALAAGEHVVAVGRDGRLSGPALAQALMRGLVAAGIEVIDIGMVTTPMLYFAAATLCRSGIQVTGSHNPRDDNGFKMVLAGRAIYGDDIQALRQMIEAQSWQRRAGGSVRTHDVLPAYTARIVGDIRLARPMKLVVDCGNGVAGATAPGVFRAIGCEVIERFTEVDGNFPNHHPDPSKPENLRDVIQALRDTDAELGLAFDGDGDRLGIVTKDGQTIYPDRQMMLFAQDVLSRVPGAPILFDVKCTQRLAPAIAAAGGQPLMFKTGHSLIKARMKEIGAPLGGEMSGHIFFAERWYGFDDGTYAGCRLLEILSRSPDASAVLNALPTSHSTPELNVACAEGEPHRLAAELQALAVAEFAAPAPSAAGPSQGASTPSGGSEPRAAGSVGADLSAAGPSQGASAPSGGSEPRAAGSVGAHLSAAGPSQGASAPSGGSEPRAAGSVGGAVVSTIDGLRVDWPDGFGLIRASNTTPVLVLRFEGHTPAALARIEGEMLALLRRVKPDAQVGGAAH